MRKTGKTFRACLKACLECSNGNNIVMIVQNEITRDITKRIIYHISGAINDVGIKKNNIIIFPNKNTITLSTKNELMQNKFKGIRFDYLEQDIDNSFMSTEQLDRYEQALSNITARLKK